MEFYAEKLTIDELKEMKDSAEILVEFAEDLAVSCNIVCREISRQSMNALYGDKKPYDKTEIRKKSEDVAHSIDVLCEMVEAFKETYMKEEKITWKTQWTHVTLMELLQER